MAKRTVQTPTKLPLQLLFSKDEAVAKIQVQIDKGEQLFSSQVNSNDDLEKMGAAEERWRKYTIELLNQLFSIDAPAKEFSRFPGVAVMNTHRPTLREKIEKLRRKISQRLNKLESIKERIDLIPLAPSALNLSEGEKKVSFDMGKVFIVHGHDDAAKTSVARFIEQLDLEPIILHEQSSWR